MLCCNLEKKRRDGNNALDARLAYYAKFPSLYIDEFSTVKSQDDYLIQKFLDKQCQKRQSTIVCCKSPLENWTELFAI